MAIRAVIYEKSTGEIKPDCYLCGLYVFSDKEAMQQHILQSGIADRTVSEVTEAEQIELAQTEEAQNKYKNKIDLKKIKTYLEDRKKEKYTVNEYGISYQNTRPISVLTKNQEDKK